ncbi:MAG: hypothetical protein J0L92_27420 [Deltaproteobacteria bacterium]|nr:hypothetical protein [Deltaproteobacteria bacterium]
MRLLVILCLVLGASACASTPTQLVVHVGSDLPTDVEPPVAGDRVLRAVRVEVCEPSCDRADAPRVERRWTVGRREDAAQGRVLLPFSFGVAPHDPASPARVEIRVEALRRVSDSVGPDDVLFATRRITAFSPGRKIDVSIFLSAGCLGTACPEGTACDDEGQCVPIEGLDAGPASLDASLDAGLDASPTIAEDAGIDASIATDAHVLDAIEVGSDAPVRDAGRDANADAPCVLPPSEMPPTTLTAEATQGINGGWVRAVAEGAPGVRLASGQYNGSFFTWDGASSPGPTHFVSRVDGDARWTVFPRLGGAVDGIERIDQLAEHDGVVYAAGYRTNAWSFAADGVPLSLSAPLETDLSLRSAITVIALDAGTGRPLWARTIETDGGGDYLGGMVVDDAGILLAWRTAASSTSTIAALRVDGVVRAIDRGPADGRIRVARLDHAGTVQWIHAIGGAVFTSVDLAPTEDGAILGLFVSRLMDGSTGFVGLEPPPPFGHVVLIRLDSDGAPLWSTAVRCADEGALSARSGAITEANGRVYAAFLATTPSLTSECGSLAIGPGAASDPVLAREESGPVWFSTFGLATCDGELAVDQLFSASVMDVPSSAIGDISADARSVAVTGHAGYGGFVMGTSSFAGIDRGPGTDGFLAILTPDLDRRFFLVLGTPESTRAIGDDYGAALARIDDTLHLGMAAGGMIVLDGTTIPGGANLVRFGLR